ncbi:MAG TPA: hypothetical protein VFG69_04925, partial [Nannocystaceae bacterium]|nr:hypothetical protein [Nannocystaceae bacterium]
MPMIARALPASVLFALALASACADSSGRDDDDAMCPSGTVLVGSECVGVTGVDDGDSDGGGSTDDSASASIGGSASSGDDDGDEGTTGALDTTSDDGSTGAPPVTMIDLHDVIIHDNPTNVADWPIATTITRLEFREGGAYVEFSKKDGDGRWPDIVPPGWEGPLQYTLGLVELIDGQWHGSAAMQYWYGLDVQGGNVAVDDQVAVNWYYDARWGEMAGYQPALGETIGVFIVAGNLRGVLDGSQ